MLRCYYMDISCDCSYEQSQALYSFLPEDRRAKVKQLKNVGMAKKRTLSSAFLQYCLSQALEIPSEEISYRYGEFGKPELSDAARNYVREKTGYSESSIEFNLSHSGKYTVLVISDTAVGIDVEKRKKNRISLAKRCFCQEEYENILNAGSAKEQDKRFLEYWTMKESYVKYNGKGLLIPLNSFCVRRGTGMISGIVPQPEGLVDTQAEVACCATMFLEEQYCVSVCCKTMERLKRLEIEKKNSEHCFEEVFLKNILDN